MRKMRIIAVALMVGLMLLGSGYAAWNDTLTINSIIETGTFNVEFIDNSGSVTSWNGISDNADSYITTGIEVENDKKSMTVSVANLYPGGSLLWGGGVINKGTIPAVFDSAEVRDLDGNALNDTLTKTIIAAGGYRLLDRFGKPKKNESGAEVCGGFTGSLSELEEKLKTTFQGLVMEPEDYFEICVPELYSSDIKAVIPTFSPKHNLFTFYLPTSAGNEVQKQAIVFQIRLFFKQFNL